MRPVSNALLAIMSQTEFLKADLYTFVLQGGSTLRFTDYDVPITVGANTFLANTLVLDRTKIKGATGLEVNELIVTAYANSGITINGIQFLQFCEQGGLDGTYITLERCFMNTTSDTSAGTVPLFYGRVSTVDVGRTKATITIKSWTEVLNADMPKNLFQPPCRWTLYDIGCTLVKASFGASSAVASGSTTSVINCTLSQAVNYFALGTITFTSGLNNGLTRTVKSYTPGVLTLAFPLPNTPGVGDTFTAYPGCDKTQATCSGKYSNLTNFRGFPYIPSTETAQ